MIGDILNICDSFSSIAIQHNHAFDFLAVAIDIFEMTSNDVVMIVHVKVKLKIFNDVECQSHYFLLFNDLASWFSRTTNNFGFLSWHQGFIIQFFLLQCLNFGVDSGYFSLGDRFVIGSFLSEQKFEFILTSFCCTFEITLNRRFSSYHISC